MAPKNNEHGFGISRVFCGTLVHSTRESSMEISENKLIGIDVCGKVCMSIYGSSSLRSVIKISKTITDTGRAQILVGLVESV